MVDPAAPSRRRRRPEEARQEILEAARKLLADRPFAAISVADVMRGTTLSRKSFYVYFPDRQALLRGLVEPLRAELDAANRAWLEAGDAATPTRDGHAAGIANLMAVGQVMHRHGSILRALADAAPYDADAGQVWQEFQRPVVDAYAARIRSEMAAGRIPALDPDATARALVRMNYATFFDEVVGADQPDLAAVADTLAQVWTRALYLAAPGVSRRGRSRTA